MSLPILGSVPPVPKPGNKWILLQVGADGALSYSTNLASPTGTPAETRQIAEAVKQAGLAIANDQGGLILP